MTHIKHSWMVSFENQLMIYVAGYALFICIALRKLRQGYANFKKYNRYNVIRSKLRLCLLILKHQLVRTTNNSKSAICAIENNERKLP